MSYRTVAVVLAGLLSATSSMAAAQVSKPMTIGVSAGLSAPIGNLGKGYETGYHLAGSLGFQQRQSPLGFRVEGMFNQFQASSGSVNLKIFNLTGNVVVSPANLLGPYLIGGAGLYNTSVSASGLSGSSSSSDVGVNFGAGFRFSLSGFDCFAEARWHQAKDANGRFVPVSFGVLF